MSTPEGSDQSGSIRAGTRDRDATAQQLQEAYADGRLTSQEHDERLSACFQAVTMGDLAALTADLPKPDRSAGSDVQAPSYPALAQGGNPPQEARGGTNSKTLAAIWSGWAVLSLFMIFIWAFSGMGSFWPVWVIVPTGFGAAMTTIARKTGGGR